MVADWLILGVLVLILWELHSVNNGVYNLINRLPTERQLEQLDNNMRGNLVQIRKALERPHNRTP
jgi:uncharacterized protein YicC (UPF0701 family)